MVRYIWMLALFGILSTFISLGETCSCQRAHPQTHFCDSDFVILARVKRTFEYKDTMEKVYKVRIRKEFKMSEKAQVALKFGRLVTAMHDSVCGAHLQPGELYVISGKVRSLRAHFTQCDFFRNWELVNKRMRKGLRMLYKNGCSCKITSNLFQKDRKNSCDYSDMSLMQCYESQGICLRQRSGNCNWVKNADLNSCVRDKKQGELQAMRPRKSMYRYSPFRDDPDRRSGQ